jgi:hypothetical protein
MYTMKTVLILTAIIYLLVAAPAFAESNHSGNDTNENLHEKTDMHQHVPDADKNPLITLSQDCDPSIHWKNHGAFVSCVAHKQYKKPHEKGNDTNLTDTPPNCTPTPTISEIPTPTQTPTETPSPTPSESSMPTESISPIPTASASPAPEDANFAIYKAPQKNIQNNVKTTLGRILFFLVHLL